MDWEGKEDLLIFSYITTNALLEVDTPQVLRVSLYLLKDRAATEVFAVDYGNKLEVFGANLLDTNYVHVLKKIERYEIQSPVQVPVPGNQGTVLGNVRFDSPQIAIECGPKSTLTLRAHLLSDPDKRVFSSGAAVSAEQSAPCTITLRYGPISHQCPFPFSVIGNKAVVRVARKSGWLEIRAPVQNVVEPIDGGYFKNLFPITVQMNSAPTSWNLPAISLDILEALDKTGLSEIHSESAIGRVLSDKEVQGGGNATFTKFKKTSRKALQLARTPISLPWLPAIGIMYEKEL
jgi:hypothetical protein